MTADLRVSPELRSIQRGIRGIRAGAARAVSALSAIPVVVPRVVYW